jgi:hypothetical protein
MKGKVKWFNEKKGYGGREIQNKGGEIVTEKKDGSWLRRLFGTEDFFKFKREGKKYEMVDRYSVSIVYGFGGYGGRGPVPCNRGQ